MTDVTNGGLRGDAHEIASTTGVGLTVFDDKIRELINPKVLEMLEKLDIDPLGVSVDSLMIIAPEDIAEEVKKAVSGANVDIAEIGYVDDTGKAKLIRNGAEEALTPLFREAAYTKIKKVVGDTTPEDFEIMKEKVQNAALAAIKKKDDVVKAVREK
jgi:hydrogenase expression/formation protein